MKRSFLSKLFFAFFVLLGSLGVGMASMPGGQGHIRDLKEKDVLNAATEGVKLLNAASNDMYSMSFVKVKSGTKQVVAGVIYRLEIECGVSRCRNDGSADVDVGSCPLVDESSTRTYQISVLWQNWMTPKYKLLDFKRTDN